jgi:hypothetical protein
VNRRQAIPTAVAVLAVAAAAIAHALMSPPPSGPLVDAAVLAAVAVCAYTATGNALHNREIRREEAADRRAAADRANALRHAADVVITGRPDDPRGSAPTPPTPRASPRPPSPSTRPRWESPP